MKVTDFKHKQAYKTQQGENKTKIRREMVSLISDLTEFKETVVDKVRLGNSSFHQFM